MDIPVAARKYTEPEVSRAFDACMDYLSVQILKDNPSLDEVSGNLSLPSDISRYGMHAEWTSANHKLLDSLGNVKNEDLRTPEEVILKVRLSDTSREHSADYELTVRIVPQKLSDAELKMKNFLSFLKKEDAGQVTKEGFILPEEYEGQRISYSQKNKENYNILWVLGILCAVLFKLRDVTEVKKADEKRNRQMMLDYPEIVSKLMVFIGAGMTIRLAWENIVTDYETGLGKGSGKKRFAYEEMGKAYSQLKTGTNEGKVYRDFGRRCGLKQYMKLAGLLEQNRKTGLANIRNILGAETSDAWEDRKNLARRTGEEASTKLLGPLFIMLVIVMIIIIVPAMMSFS